MLHSIEPAFVCQECDPVDDAMWLLDRSPPPTNGHHWTHPLVYVHAAATLKKTSSGDENAVEKKIQEMKEELENAYETKHRALEERLQHVEDTLKSMQEVMVQILHSIQS
jgi:hypothetical protein